MSTDDTTITPKESAEEKKARKRARAIENLKLARATERIPTKALHDLIDVKALERCANADLTDKQLAIVLEITPRQLKSLRLRPDFIEIMARGKAEATKVVESSLFAAATGVEFQEITRERVLVGRVRDLTAEQKEQGSPLQAPTKGHKDRYGAGHGQERIYHVENKLVITKIVSKRTPADVEAIKFYLSNVEPAKWKIRSNVDSSTVRKVEVAELAGKNVDQMRDVLHKVNQRIKSLENAADSAVKN
jgi:hypothetical protein